MGYLFEMEILHASCESRARVRSTVTVKIAAVGDLHIRGSEERQEFAELRNLSRHADLLVVAGDLTENGRIIEAEAAGELLASCRLPVVSVLGNHDLRGLRRAAFRRALECHGIEVLEGRGTCIEVRNGVRVGIAGATGCGGGFWPIEGPNAIHNRALKRLAVRARREIAALDEALGSIQADVEIAVTHFSPTTSTLGREPLAKYWMLGNCELGMVLDEWRPDLVIHGHAHLGNRLGTTPGGLPVRNVAWPVVGGIHTEVLEVRPASGVMIAPAFRERAQWREHAQR
jgi:Icc-related predicted phosphoesterase